MAGTGGRIPKQNQKLSGFSTAVGSWDSGGTWRRINAEQTPERIRVFLQDKMISRGKRVGLWIPVHEGDAGTVPCTCEKVSTDASQRRCDSCYGTKTVPGYSKFLHQTIFFASAEASGFTLTNTAVSTQIKPNPILLSPGVLTGTIDTPDKPWTNPLNADFSVGLNAFLRAPGATVALEYSIDAGLSFQTIALTGSGGLLTGTIPGSVMTGSGLIRFRVTMTRVNATDAPTAFEILRIRRAMPENSSLNLKRLRPDMVPGEILIEKTWVREVAALVSGYGRVITHESDGAWTCPLDFFDVTINRDTPTAKIDDTGAGPHPFYEYTESVQAATRYSMTEIDYDTQLGIFTHQAFVDQRIQAGDFYQLVF